MSVVSCDGALIEAWAAFSGDRNPIHFDPAAARRLGAEDVVVHGMVPVTLAMSAAERAWPPNGHAAGWRQCRVRIKRPLIKDQAARVSVKTADDGVRFSLVDDRGGSHLVGTLGNEPLLSPRPDHGNGRRVELAPFDLDAATVRQEARAFQRVFPAVSSSWIALSAILFARLVKGRIDVLKADSLSWAGRLALDATDATTVQTSHTVLADESWFGGRTVEELDAVQCDFAPVSVFRIDQGFAGDCWLRARSQGRPVMEIGVGLLMKLSS